MTRLTVTLCGSLTRAAHDLTRIHRALALAGHLVHAPVPALPGEPPIRAEQRDQLAGRHYAAIERSDLVIAVIPDQATGEATAAEIRYAQRAGKPVWWVYDVAAFLADIAAGRLTQREVPA